MRTARMILFFFVLSLPATAAEEMASVQEQGGVNAADLRLLLNSFGALGEGHVENVLRGLRIMSVTEEAQSGEWDKMKGMLAEFGRSGIKAACVWFVRPDGSYYTPEKGLTGLNLRYREYFPGLMAGGEIIGDLVLSTSTGKRSVIVAVPVKKNGKIIGALGTSLAVEDISRMLDEKMGLPGNMFFYALDKKGQTALHKVSALLFAYPSDMGSKSLSKTVGEMLSRPEGVVTYDFYGERLVVFRKFPLTGWVFAIGIVTGKPGQSVAELPPILSELEKEITAELNKVDQDVARLAGSLAGEDLKAAGTRKMLGDLCRSCPYAVDCAVVDRNGRMVLVVPEEYSEFEGSDISAQEQIIRLQKSKKPVLSNVIKTVEGIDAVDLEHPVFSADGELAGSVSVLFRAESLFSYVITPVLKGMPAEAFVMQTDGRILYDADKEEVGRMLFDDPLYKPFPQLLALGTLISKEEKGSGSYEFRQEGSEKVVKKDAYWTTVGLHGTLWRLVMMHVRAGHALSSGEDIAKTRRASYDDALRSLAENADMKKALSGGDRTGIRRMFTDFYAQQAGLYSVQWLDSQGMNRYGYPEENSLINFDVKTSKTPSSKPMLRALSGKKESSFDCPLMEGKTGAFFMVPVYEGDEYLGMIYTIRIKE
ncbi:MAG: cache domain-containing protein [Nitrospirota bacterium]|nr:cache domain-containing protein [Nitrospirota bacterium]